MGGATTGVEVRAPKGESRGKSDARGAGGAIQIGVEILASLLDKSAKGLR